MIELTRFDGSKIHINPFQIEYIEETPHTVIFMSSGRKYIVKESIDEINRKIINFFKKVIEGETYGHSYEEK